jgi:hypothetical protein
VVGDVRRDLGVFVLKGQTAFLFGFLSVKMNASSPKDTVAAVP